MSRNWRFDDYYAIRLVDFLIENPDKDIGDEYSINWTDARYYIKVMRRVCRTYGKGWYTPEQIKNFHKAIYKERAEGKIFTQDFSIPSWRMYFELTISDKKKTKDRILSEMKKLGIECNTSHGRYGPRIILDEESYKKFKTIDCIDQYSSLVRTKYVKGKIRYYVNAYFLDIQPL